jgi:electron transfer flavoprotein beta subunit
MRICVCVKDVPPPTVPRRLDPATGRLVRPGRGHINAPDNHALEEGLRLRDAAGEGEVTAVTMAPTQASESVRHALAMGADRAVLVADDLLAGSDLVATSRVLAAVLERERSDVVLCGWEGTDSNGAMLWAAVAERMGLPVLSRVWKLDITNGQARARRQMEYGFDVAEAPLPCVVALSGAINVPRYPSLKGIVASKRKPIEMLSVAQLGLDGGDVGAAGARTRVVSVGPPPPRTGGAIIEGEDGLPARLLEWLDGRGVL